MRKKKKLIWHILLPYLLITLLSLIGLAAYTSVALRHFLLDQTRTGLKTRARLLEDPVASLLARTRMQEDIDPYCKSLGRATAMRITVILPSGKVVGDSSHDPAEMDNHRSRPEVMGAMAGGISSSMRYSRTLGRRMMYVATELKGDNGKLLAVLRVAVPITFIDDELWMLSRKIAFGGLVVAVLAGVVCVLVSKRITRPISAMQAGAQRFAQGDLSHRLTPPDTEETAALAETLNHMAAEIQNRIQAVVNQRNELESVLFSMREGVMAVDRQTHIASANRAAAGMLGADPQDMQGKRVMEIVRNLELRDFVRRALESPGPVEDDLTLQAKGRRIVNARSAPLMAADGSLTGRLIVLNDVTELRRLENVRKDFVANVSHEIKTPLTAIKGFIETIRYGPAEPMAETRRFLGIIERHVNRLNAIVDDLLALSRLEQTDRLPGIDRHEVHIRNVLQTALQVCQAAADEKRMSLELACPADLAARVDETLLEQALINLVDNAVKYSEAGTSVSLAAGIEENALCIRVRDHGRGIAKKHLPRLFERFYRIDKARSRKLGGTGLGLAIVKHIVNAHGGRIDVESALGRGSTFTIYLPASLPSDV